MEEKLKDFEMNCDKCEDCYNCKYYDPQYPQLCFIYFLMEELDEEGD